MFDVEEREMGWLLDGKTTVSFLFKNRKVVCFYVDGYDLLGREYWWYRRESERIAIGKRG